MSARGVGAFQVARARLRRKVATRISYSTVPSDSTRIVMPTTQYVICTNPRSGSWLLCEGLAATAIAGNPREWFNSIEEQEHRARWRGRHASDLGSAEYLRVVQAASTTRNGICGLKLMYYQFAELPQRLQTLDSSAALTASQSAAKLFPGARYIWLTRRDKVRQAISLQIASGTDQWWEIDGVAPRKRSDYCSDPEFDGAAIARLERGLVENDAQWKAFFEQNRIVPLVIQYEDLAADYRHTIETVLSWLGVGGAGLSPIPPPRLKRQSNHRNEDWFERYARYKREYSHSTETDAADETTRKILHGNHEQSGSISNSWKEWVAQSKFLQNSDLAIVDTLIRNGISPDAARAEVASASAHPYMLGGAAVQKRLGKASALLRAQQQVARLDSKALLIARRADIGSDEFRDHYYAANRPVVIRNQMRDWAAMTRWTPDYLKAVAGDHVVEVMTGRDANPDYERDGGRHRTLLRFADYVDRVYAGGVTNDYYMVANNEFLQRPEARLLFEDFRAFPQYLDPATLQGHCFLWFGPAGTVTPLHHDTSNILVAQVAGRKRYRLIPPNQWQYVYNSSGVFSEVDCENPDLQRHPEFNHVTAIDVTLAPGEVLFVPVGWWHCVRALDVSMSISFTNFRWPNHFSWE